VVAGDERGACWSIFPSLFGCDMRQRAGVIEGPLMPRNPRRFELGERIPRISGGSERTQGGGEETRGSHGNFTPAASLRGARAPKDFFTIGSPNCASRHPQQEFQEAFALRMAPRRTRSRKASMPSSDSHRKHISGGGHRSRRPRLGLRRQSNKCARRTKTVVLLLKISRREL